MMEKNESKTLKIFVKSQNLKRINKLNEYSKEKNSKLVEDKFKKFQDFNSQRQKMKEIKREISIDIAFKKNQILKKLDYVQKRQTYRRDFP